MQYPNCEEKRSTLPGEEWAQPAVLAVPSDGQSSVPPGERRHSEYVEVKRVINTNNQMHIDFPDGEFTVDELEKANPQMPREIVASKLAIAIFEHSVEFVSGWGPNPVIYRKKEK